MTKKDYVLFAKVLNNTLKHYNQGLPVEVGEFVHILMGYMTEALSEDNERFDEAKFRRAVYGKK
jgi:hypothetical protein